MAAVYAAAADRVAEIIRTAGKPEPAAEPAAEPEAQTEDDSGDDQSEDTETGDGSGDGSGDGEQDDGSVEDDQSEDTGEPDQIQTGDIIVESAQDVTIVIGGDADGEAQPLS